jgi:hypothetical protein
MFPEKSVWALFVRTLFFPFMIFPARIARQTPALAFDIRALPA